MTWLHKDEIKLYCLLKNGTSIRKISIILKKTKSQIRYKTRISEEAQLAKMRYVKPLKLKKTQKRKCKILNCKRFIPISTFSDYRYCTIHRKGPI